MHQLTLQPSRPWDHLKVSPGVWFFINHLAAQDESTAHDHNYLELAFIMKGRAKHCTVWGERTCRPGDVYIIPVGSWHGYTHCEDLELYNCLLSPTLLQEELAWMTKDRTFRDLLGSHASSRGVHRISIASAQRDQLREALERLHAAHNNHASKAEILAHLLLVIDRLRTGRKADQTRTATTDLEHPSVRRALTALQSDIAREWTLRELAAPLNLTPSYLVRLFRTTTGESPMKYLDRMRAEQAANLLISTRLRIGDIGQRVGWPEPKQFARSFQRHFGSSASIYRQRMATMFPAVEQDHEDPAST